MKYRSQKPLVVFTYAVFGILVASFIYGVWSCVTR